MKMYKGCAVYETDGGYEYIVRHGRECDGFEWNVIEQLNDGAIKLVRKHRGKVYKVTFFEGADAYRRAVIEMEAAHDAMESY